MVLPIIQFLTRDEEAAELRRDQAVVPFARAQTAEPKIDLYRGSEARQSRIRFCRRCSQALQEEFFSWLIYDKCKRKRRRKATAERQKTNLGSDGGKLKACGAWDDQFQGRNSRNGTLEIRVEMCRCGNVTSPFVTLGVRNFGNSWGEELWTIAVTELLGIATQDMFLHKNKLYKLIDGATLGSPLGPTLANFFLATVEKKLLA